MHSRQEEQAHFRVAYQLVLNQDQTTLLAQFPDLSKLENLHSGVLSIRGHLAAEGNESALQFLDSLPRTVTYEEDGVQKTFTSPYTIEYNDTLAGYAFVGNGPKVEEKLLKSRSFINVAAEFYLLGNHLTTRNKAISALALINDAEIRLALVAAIKLMLSSRVQPTSLGYDLDGTLQEAQILNQQICAHPRAQDIKALMVTHRFDFEEAQAWMSVGFQLWLLNNVPHNINLDCAGTQTNQAIPPDIFYSMASFISPIYLTPLEVEKLLTKVSTYLLSDSLKKHGLFEYRGDSLSFKLVRAAQAQENISDLATLVKNTAEHPSNAQNPAIEVIREHAKRLSR